MFSLLTFFREEVRQWGVSSHLVHSELLHFVRDLHHVAPVALLAEERGAAHGGSGGVRFLLLAGELTPRAGP